jgi:hypothetical protein
MMRVPFRNVVQATLAASVWLMWPAAPTAHRLDEYLQATRIAVDGDRVDVGIDLTPGTAVARQVFGWIDTDQDGEISSAEGDAYAAAVLSAIRLDVDDHQHSLTLVTRRFPTLGEMRLGVGTVQLTATASVPRAAAGPHHLLYRNMHQPDLSVYLVNALVPDDPGIEITGQRRDRQQHELRLDYRVGTSASSSPAWRFLAAGGMASVLMAALWRRRRRG